MKKIKIFLIIAIAVIGALYIYNKFKDIKIEDIQIDKFLSEYTLIDENHSFEIINIDEGLNILNDKTGVLLFCNSGSEWCQYYVKYLDEISIEKELDKIYYLDIKEERSMNSNKYKKLLTKLNDFIPVDDTGNKRINMPTLIFFKDGNIINANTTTSIISTDITPIEYWNNKTIVEFKNNIYENLELLNTYNDTIDNDIEEGMEEEE